MRRIFLIAILLTVTSPVAAQDVPGFPTVPQLPPPILPKIEVPKVPQFDAPASPSPQKRPRQTFQDRAIRCQHEAGAAGLNAGAAGAYVRACANQ